jgi:hypothetical protein
VPALQTWPPEPQLLPVVAFAQVPLVPPVSAAEHAWHVPVHAELQQYPFAQKPLVHWSVAVHAAPFAPLGTQVPDVPGFLQ